MLYIRQHSKHCISAFIHLWTDSVTHDYLHFPSIRTIYELAGKLRVNIHYMLSKNVSPKYYCILPVIYALQLLTTRRSLQIPVNITIDIIQILTGAEVNTEKYCPEVM